jgi:hypothetical protein
MSQKRQFLKNFKLVFSKCPGTLDFIFCKISLRKVPDFEKFIKNTLRKKLKSLIFSGIKLPLPVTINAEKVFVENGLNDQKTKLKI